MMKLILLIGVAGAVMFLLAAIHTDPGVAAVVGGVFIALVTITLWRPNGPRRRR